MNHPNGEAFNVDFDKGIKLQFHRGKVTSNSGLLAHLDLDDIQGLFHSVSANSHDDRTNRNIQHDIPTLLRKSV